MSLLHSCRSTAPWDAGIGLTPCIDKGERQGGEVLPLDPLRHGVGFQSESSAVEPACRLDGRRPRIKLDSASRVQASRIGHRLVLLIRITSARAGATWALPAAVGVEVEREVPRS